MKTLMTSNSLYSLSKYGNDIEGTKKPQQNTAELLITKAKRFLSNSDKYDGKDLSYLTRLNNLMNNNIYDIEQEIRRKTTLKDKFQSMRDLSLSQIGDPKKSLDEVQKELKENQQIIEKYRAQLQKLEQRRQVLLDPKYKYELNQEILQLRQSVNDLRQICLVNKARKKKLKPTSDQQQNKAVKQSKKDVAPAPNEPKAPQSSMKVLSNRQLGAQQQTNQKQNIPLDNAEITNPLDKYKKDEVSVKDLELINVFILMEKSLQAAQELDVYNQRNSRQKEKVEKLHQIIQNLSQRHQKVDDRYQQLQNYANDNQITDKPGMEDKHDQLILRIATLEKSIMLAKNMYELRIEDFKNLIHEIQQVCDDRSQTCTLLKTELMNLKNQIVEMRAIQDSFQMNEKLTLNSLKQSQNRVLSFQGEHAQIQSLLETKNNSLYQSLAVEPNEKNQYKINLDNDQATARSCADQYLTDLWVNLLDDNKVNIIVEKQQLIENRTRIGLQIFDKMNKDIETTEDAQNFLQQLLKELANREDSLDPDIVNKWLKINDKDSDGKLSRDEINQFLREKYDMWYEKLSKV